MKTAHRGVGILGIGRCLGSEQRHNSWWAPAVVKPWGETAARTKKVLESKLIQARRPGEKLALAAMISELDDPFRGTLVRPVAPPEARASDLETEASREALTVASIDARRVDIVLVNSFVPDYLTTNNACTVHHALGMRPNAMAVWIEAACNSFMMQMSYAAAMIRSGAASYALLVQSTLASRLLPYDESYSAWFGDAATAVVVGPVEANEGFGSEAHRTDGSMQATLISGVPGKRWYDDGKMRLYAENVEGAHRMFPAVPDGAVEVAEDALDKAGLAKRDVTFYASHQGTSWLREVCKRAIGVDHAKGHDTFKSTASIIACNVPLQLYEAVERGTLVRGDWVLATSGGSGITTSAITMRWAA